MLPAVVWRPPPSYSSRSTDRGGQPSCSLPWTSCRPHDPVESRAGREGGRSPQDEAAPRLGGSPQKRHGICFREGPSPAGESPGLSDPDRESIKADACRAGRKSGTCLVAIECPVGIRRPWFENSARMDQGATGDDCRSMVLFDTRIQLPLPIDTIDAVPAIRTPRADAQVAAPGNRFLFLSTPCSGRHSMNSVDSMRRPATLHSPERSYRSRMTVRTSSDRAS
jgi:hypothetical protein